ncbi:hypothetical protein EVC14_004 [Rhizobium phage RHph_I3_18]|nr:hypothetical protein EVC14_004 [Rhizobium phage RHph_I3_18]
MAEDDNTSFEQADYDPSIDKESSKAWLNLIKDAEKALDDWQGKSDSIDKRYADLSRLANVSRDREFQLFWANIQVLGPSVYSRPPAPVVVPRFRDRRAVPRTASELLERCTSVAFEKDDIDGTMRMIRDDLVRLARGCVWLRYEDKEKKGKKAEKVCIEHVDRRDWICSPARKWQEVDWVARRAWMTPDEMKARFTEYSGDAWESAAFTENDRDKQDRGNRDPLRKAGVWEIWCKSEDRVVWVTEGVEELLDANEPHLKLEGFFPCPRPAYGTLQPGSLVPVPDYVYYKDQIEEINELTGRIAALSEAIKVKGFYAAGGEIGNAVEAAMKKADDGATLVPVSNWSAFGSGGDPIIWLPIDMIATTVAGLVELRKQLIDDVYQITGLSDIMRGQSDPNETLGAQEIKSQYGSVRVRDRQGELVRIALDITRITAEIMAENFDKQTLMDMSQMDLPTDAEIKKQVKELEDQGKQIIKAAEAKAKESASNPQMVQQAQQDPEAAQKAAMELQQQAQQQIEGVQQQIQKLGETVTIDQVMKLLNEQRLRPFALDIETDSTIAPDENAQKQRATEFVTAVGGFLNQAITAVQAVPQSAPLMADTLKYVASQFRAGRELDNSIDEFADSMKQMAASPKPNPEADAAQAQMQADQQRLAMEQQKHQEEQQARAQDEMRKQQAAKNDADIKAALADHEAKQREIVTGEKVQAIRIEAGQKAQKHTQDMELGTLDIEKKKLEIVKLGGQIQADAQQAEISADHADREADHSEQSFQQQTRLNEQKAQQGAAE